MRSSDEENADDLMSGGRGFSEAVFATIVLLCRNRGQRDLRMAALRVAAEFLQLFRVVFTNDMA